VFISCTSSIRQQACVSKGDGQGGRVAQALPPRRQKGQGQGGQVRRVARAGAGTGGVSVARVDREEEGSSRTSS
jgi:hypothetical protein